MISAPQMCPICKRSFEATRFDPPPPDPSVLRLAEAGPTGANPCAHHPGNAAIAHCSRCGVFICALCRIEVDRRTLCPGCFERLSDEGGLPSMVTRYRDYGRAQALLALLGVLVIFLGPVTGPGSLYYGVRRLRQMKRMNEPEGRWRVQLLLALGVVEAVVGVGVYVAMVRP
jgi:hypothetical protein